jgi:predicted ATPase
LVQHSSERQSFGSLLRRYRTDQGLTQDQLAERTGLSRRGIADLERGARLAPYAHTLEQLRAALDLSEGEYRALVEAARPQPAGGLDTGAERRRAQHNLPIRPTRFVGREPDRAHIASLLQSSPLVTLVGPGGVGKTRLALEAADDQVGRLDDGVWLVELAALGDPTMVAESIAAALDLQQRSGFDSEDDLVEWLRNKRMLLVLDNCEHMVEVCARLITHIVRSCANVRVLTTSR